MRLLNQNDLRHVVSKDSEKKALFAYVLSFRNANAGDLYVNWRGSGYRRIVRKPEGLGISKLYINWRGSGYQRRLV